MSTFLPFIAAGLVSGVIYGLAGTSLVMTYKTSGIFNFGQGAMATVGAYIFFFLWVKSGVNWLVALALVIFVVGPLMGLAMERLTRTLAHQRPQWKIVGTIGLILVMQGIGAIWYGPNTIPVSQYLPGSESFVSVLSVNISYSQIIVVALALVVMLGLLVMFRFTRLGIAMRAVVEDPDLASMDGVNPTQVRRIAWMLGSSIVALSGALLLPLVGLDPLVITLLVIDTFAAAAIGRFSSIPLTFVGGVLIAIGESILTKFEVSSPSLLGISSALPFAVLLAVMILIPRNKLVTPSAHETRPKLIWHGPPKVRRAMYVIVFAGLASVPLWAPGYLITPYWSGALIEAILILSLGLMRSAGIVSLCTVTFAAFGAVVFSHLFVGLGVPWILAVLLSGVAVAPVGALVAWPAIRLSGLFLALGTLGFGLLVQQLVYPRGWMFTQDVNGRIAPRPSWALSDQTYYYVVLGFLVLMVVLIGLINRARLGRLVRAISDSSKAVSVLGLNVQGTRVLVFSVAAFMAAIAGSLHAALIGGINDSDPFFAPFSSIILLAVLALSPFRVPWYGIFAGVTSVIPGYITGADVTPIMNVIFGVSAISVAAQGGIQQMPLVVQRFLESRFGKAEPEQFRGSVAGKLQTTDRTGVSAPEPAARTGLTAEGLRIQFGGLVAVDNVSLAAPMGRITGLIGPNGAGKTTTFDACSGLNTPRAGDIGLNGFDITKLPPDARARLGLGRTFQIVELCDSLTVAENVALGWEASRGGRRWHTQLSARSGANAARLESAAAAMALCGIEELSGRQAGSLSTGQRRLVDLARALAGPFDILLLDEPSSGLGPEETAKFAEVLRSVVKARGCGILLVEHDMSLVMDVCDHIYVLDFGRLIFNGTPSEVSASEIVQTAYLGESSSKDGSAVLEELAEAASDTGAGNHD